ncbi:hypothetical protein KY360_05455 [Candidatus Woesearchaeota archaeon]|nr:hypothetical protein [Candidatus Woesearchaeota archaeon]
MTGEGEKSLHERDLTSLLKSLRNYSVPGQAGTKKLDRIRSTLGDEIKAGINKYLTSKKGLGHAKDEDTGMPAEFSIGKQDLKGNYNHARAIVLQIAKSVVGKRHTKKAVEGMPEDVLLSYLDKYLRPLGADSLGLIKHLAEDAYEDIYKSKPLKDLIEKSGEIVATDIRSEYRSAITHNKEHLSALEKKAQAIHPKAEWAKGLENDDYLTHVEANWTGAAKTAEHVTLNKKHFKNFKDMQTEYSKE